MDTADLVKFIHLSAIGSYIPIYKKFPDLAEIMKKGKTTSADWDILFTAAGVGIALSINIELNRDVVINTCTSINPKISAAIDNYFSFIGTEKINNREMLRLQTGVWMIWNLLKEEPVYEEHKELVSFLGRYIDSLLK
ncbi:MAG: hypothetical protein NTZ55_02880 [Candidatus Roizmanbacteria bacterium]|nr:hypothetical protein [Candidatus Roizmanbacteria bacterium]